MYVLFHLPPTTATDYLDGIPDLTIPITNLSHMGESPLLTRLVSKLTEQHSDTLGSHMAIVSLPSRTKQG